MSTIGDRVVMTCGTMRSGSSLTMQCLDSAGVECLGSYPAFEDRRSAAYGLIPMDLMLDAQGKAVKILEPYERIPPKPFDYYVIAMDRGKKEQAKSYYKFSKRLGARFKVGQRKAVSKFRSLLYQRHRMMMAILENLPNRTIVPIQFEDLVGDPRNALMPIAADLDLDIDRMILPVRERGPECLEEVLEDRLLASV